MSGRAVTVRFRVPVRTRRRRRCLSGKGLRTQRRRRCLRGGFLPALIPLIAAAIGAVPGIASVALQAAHKT